MNRFWESFFYGLIVTVAIMGPAFGFGVLYTLATGGDAVAYAGDCIVLSFVVMGFSTWGLYELRGALDRANRPRSEDRDQDTGNRDQRHGDARNEGSERRDSGRNRSNDGDIND